MVGGGYHPRGKRGLAAARGAHDQHGRRRKRERFGQPLSDRLENPIAPGEVGRRLGEGRRLGQPGQVGLGRLVSAVGRALLGHELHHRRADPRRRRGHVGGDRQVGLADRDVLAERIVGNVGHPKVEERAGAELDALVDHLGERGELVAELLELLPFRQLDTARHDQGRQSAAAAAGDQLPARQASRHALGAFQILLIGGGEQDDGIGELVGADAAHLGDAGAAVDQHHVVVAAQLLAEPVEELLAVIPDA